MTGAVNLHATAIVLGATGILITGPSGAGKSALALSLIRAGRLHGLYASLVADDQVLISASNGRAVAAAPRRRAAGRRRRGRLRGKINATRDPHRYAVDAGDHVGR